jgi:hypothetical protein
MMNTKLNLLYRDASNYKDSKEVVLAGEITAEQIAVLGSKLDEGEYFIAEQVGLPTPSFEYRGKDGWPNEDLDHVFTTLTDFSEGLPEATSMLTDEEPTEEIDIDDLVARFATVESWGVETEWARMKAAA